MAAFTRAMADGADGIECDLRLTADGNWVVHHDADITIGGKRRRIADMTLAELDHARVGPSGDAIPTLAGLLQWAEASGTPLVLDIKDAGSVDTLVAAVESARLPVSPVFSSFDRSVIRAIRHRRPERRAALIVGALRTGIMRRLYAPAIVRWAQLHGVAALHMHGKWVTPSLITRAHTAGLQLAIWTVDDPGRIALLAALGVDSIVTNRPDLARRIVHQMFAPVGAPEPPA